MRASLAAGALTAALGAALAAGGQTPAGSTTSFPAAIEQVLVDVVVADGEGNAVGGLTRDDFVLAEDGHPQTVLSFEAMEVAAGGPVRDPLEPLPTVSANVAAGGHLAARTFFVLFDDMRLTPAQGEAAKRALAGFVSKSVDDADNLLLVTTESSTWWGARVNDGRDDLLAVIDGLRGRFQPEMAPDDMTDAEAFRIEVQRDADTFNHVLRRTKKASVFGNPAAPRAGAVTGLLDGTECSGSDPDRSQVCQSARITYVRAVARLRDTLGRLERGITALGGVRGRKSAILVSPGFYHDVDLEEFGRVADASRRANAPVYFLRASGLADMPVEMTAQVGQPIDPGDISLGLQEATDAAAGSDVIAAETGGFVVRNTNNLTKGLRRIADEARRYYLLGYTSSNVAHDGKYRKIQVTFPPGRQAAREGWQIRARRGYDAPKDGGARRDPEAPMREALASPFDLAGLPVRVAAYALESKSPGLTRCLLVGEVDVRSLAFRSEEGRSLASLDVAFTTTTREGGSTTQGAQRVDMKLHPATRERLNRDWYVVTHEIELPPGIHQARLVVREIATGRIGSVIHRIDVADPAAFRITTPLVSDLLEPVAKGTPPRLAPIARREFTVGSRVFLSLDVFGAERGAASGQPRVSMGYEVVRPDGEVVTRLEPKRIDPTPEGGLHRVVGFTLPDARPGEYRLEGQVEDEQTGKTLLFTEPFTLRPPATGRGDTESAAPPRP